MRSIDVTYRVHPNDMDPYDEYKVTLKATAHLHYAYSIDKGCI